MAGPLTEGRRNVNSEWEPQSPSLAFDEPWSSFAVTVPAETPLA